MLANLVAGSGPDHSFEHTVVSMMSGAEVAERIRCNGVTVHTLGMRRGRASPRAALRFVSLLRRERPSILQTWLYHADLLGLLARPVLRIPVVWNIRSAWHQGIDGFAPRACARLSGLPAAVVVNSHAGQEIHSQRGYRPRRWRLIPNGFDLDVFKPDPQARVSLRSELGLDWDTPLIGMVGRWDPHKGHATFLAGAALLKKEYPSVHFVLVGEGLNGENDAVCELVRNAGLTECVHLLGKRTDIPRVTAAFDIASCTSIGEAFPNVVGEAMAAGVPCVATDVGDSALIVRDRNLIVPSANPPALAAAWAGVLALDSAARQAKGTEVRAKIADGYSLTKVIGQYESLYRELLAVGE